MPYQIGTFLLEEHLGVLWDRDRIKLRSASASAVLAVLAECALQGRGLVSHAELLDTVWRRRGVHVKKDSVYTAIHTLRTELGEASIESIYGAGIRLVLPVSRVDAKRDTTGSSLLLPGDPPRILVMPFCVSPIDDPLLADRVTEQISALLVSHHHVVDHALQPTDHVGQHRRPGELPDCRREWPFDDGAVIPSWGRLRRWGWGPGGFARRGTVGQ